MDPLWIVFITIGTVFIISGFFEFYRSKRIKRNGVVNLDINTTSNGSGMVYTIPTTQQLSSSYPSMNTHTTSTPVFIVQDTPPSYDQVVNMCPPPTPGSTGTTASNSTLTTTTTMTTIHER